MFQFAALTLFLLTNTAAARAIAWEYIDVLWVRYTFVGCTAVCTGLWLGSCFGHLKRSRVFMAWAGLLVVSVIFEAVVIGFSERGAPQGTLSWGIIRDVLRRVLDTFLMNMRYHIVLAVLTVLVFALVPMGGVLRWVNRALIRAQFRRRKRNLRRLRDDR